MLPRSLQIIRRFNHKHSDKANSFLPKNDFKIEYDKFHESEDKLNENIQDINDIFEYSDEVTKHTLNKLSKFY